MDHHDDINSTPYEELIQSNTNPSGDEDNPSEPPAQGG